MQTCRVEIVSTFPFWGSPLEHVLTSECSNFTSVVSRRRELNIVAYVSSHAAERITREAEGVAFVTVTVEDADEGDLDVTQVLEAQP